MSEARQLILAALQRLSPEARDSTPEPEPAVETAPRPTPETPPQLSEDALIRALEGDAAALASITQAKPATPEPPQVEPQPLDEVIAATPSVEESIEDSIEVLGDGNGSLPIEIEVSDPTDSGNGATPIPELPPADSDPDRELQTDTVVLSNTLRALEGVSQRDDIARVVLEYAKVLFKRSALFVIKREMVAGWEGSGEGLSQKTIRAILIPLSTPSVFKTVYETKVLYYGGVPRTTVNDLFLNAIGTQNPPQRVVVLPFVLKGKVVCTMYADGGAAEDLSPRMIGQLYQLGRAVSSSFEQLIIRAKQKR